MLIGSYMHVSLGVLLTAVAGYVDAIGYLALGGFFASFMSGASISLGVGMSEGQWSAVYEAALLIAVFLAGTTVATVMAGVTGVWALSIVLLLTSLYLAFGFLAVSGPAARVAGTAMLVSIVLFFKRRTRTHTVSNNPT